VECSREKKPNQLAQSITVSAREKQSREGLIPRLGGQNRHGNELFCGGGALPLAPINPPPK
jgi:hypothetical protein